MPRVDHWTERLVRSRHGLALLFGISFLEATVLPLPLEVILIPYMLKARQILWSIATTAFLGFMAASVAGYYVGAALFDTAGVWLLEAFDLSAQYQAFQEEFRRNGFWAILVLGLTPLQFQIAMLTAGAANYPLPLFLLATAITRSLIYYGLGLLVVVFGDRALQLWQRLPRKAGLLLLALAALAYVAVALW